MKGGFLRHIKTILKPWIGPFSPFLVTTKQANIASFLLYHQQIHELRPKWVMSQNMLFHEFVGINQTGAKSGKEVVMSGQAIFCLNLVLL